MGLESDLHGLIGNELHELAWNQNFPINPTIGIQAFLEAFRTHSFFEVNEDSEKRVASFSALPVLNGSSFSFEVSLTYKEILEGWKQKPKSCPQTFYDSICIVYDKVGKIFKDFNRWREEREEWFNVRSRDVREIRQKMENCWLPYFLKHHEHMLLPTVGRVPPLRKPLLIRRVIKEFPMDILRDAIDFRPSLGPTAESIVKHYPQNAPLKFDIEFNQDENEGLPFRLGPYKGYHPSESTMVDLFLGRYLDELAREKGYDLKRDEEERMRDLVVLKGDALERGKVNWQVDLSCCI